MNPFDDGSPSSHRRRLLGREDVRPVPPRRSRTLDADELSLLTLGGDDVQCRGRDPGISNQTGELVQTTAACESPTPSSAAAEQEHVIELSGGLVVPLRLSQETEMAWAMDRHSEACCFVCETRVACVRDCDSFICPECLSIIPLETKKYHLESSLSWSVSHCDHRGGVGVGLKMG